MLTTLYLYLQEQDLLHLDDLCLKFSYLQFPDYYQAISHSKEANPGERFCQLSNS